MYHSWASQNHSSRLSQPQEPRKAVPNLKASSSNLISDSEEEDDPIEVDEEEVVGGGASGVATMRSAGTKNISPMTERSERGTSPQESGGEIPSSSSEGQVWKLNQLQVPSSAGLSHFNASTHTQSIKHHQQPSTGPKRSPSPYDQLKPRPSPYTIRPSTASNPQSSPLPTSSSPPMAIRRGSMGIAKNRPTSSWDDENDKIQPKLNKPAKGKEGVKMFPMFDAAAAAPSSSYRPTSSKVGTQARYHTSTSSAGPSFKPQTNENINDDNHPHPASSSPDPNPTKIDVPVPEEGGGMAQETVELSEEQQKILELAMSGKSMFFTGSAGTGKSVLLRAIISAMRTTRVLHPDGTFRPRRVAVTASTGIAALNVGGQTLHSWSGVGLGEEPAHVLYKKILLRGQVRGSSRKGMGKGMSVGRGKKVEEVQRGSALERWLMDDVLIIDEISMIDGKFFDKLEQVGRMVRDDMKPFGGIQIILCGDFFQLPPVPDRHTRTSVFAFQAQTWEKSVPHIFMLKKVFRQKNQRFADMLNEARMGICSPRSTRMFASLEREVTYTDGIQATELFPMRNQAENANTARLEALAGTPRIFNSIDIPGKHPEGRLNTYPETVKLLDSYARASSTVELKLGAQVMLTTNLTPTMANGSLGRIVGFEQAAPPPSIMEKISGSTSNGKKGKNRSMAIDLDVPGGRDDDEDEEEDGCEEALLKVSTDKDQEEDDDDEGFKKIVKAEIENGQDIKPDVKPSAVQKQEKDRMSTGPEWPLVEFAGGERMLITSHEFDVTSVTGDLEARRIQVPLILAWALSIHKAQGLSLPRMKVDLLKVFEKGQAYVALSRAVSMDTLEIQNFKPQKVFAHSTVIEWSKNLSSM